MSLKKVVFWINFYVTFLLTGLYTSVSILITGAQHFPTGMAISLVIPLFLKYRIKINQVTTGLFLLSFVIVVSGITNHSSIREVLDFIKFPVYTFLVYCICSWYLNERTVLRVIRLSILIALIQLPVILLQKHFYHSLPAAILKYVIYVDIGFGTFRMHGDTKMAFFLVLILIFLLFDARRNYVISHRWFIIAWLSLTILIADSNINRVILLIVYGIFLISRRKYKEILLVLLIICFLGGALALTGAAQGIAENLTTRLRYDFMVSEERIELFLEGGYSRAAAIAYYLDQDLKILGDGPSAYTDLSTGRPIVGNYGHIFRFYSEVGLAGLLLSYWILLAIAMPIHRGRVRWSWVSFVSFLAIIISSFTTDVLVSTGSMMPYCVLLSARLIPPRKGGG